MRFVSSLGIRRQLRRRQRHLALIAAVLVLSGMVAAHHSGMDTQHEAAMGAAVELCLGVFTAIGTVLVASGCTVAAAARWRPALTLLSTGTPTPTKVPVARARHGPAAVAVLCVSRR